MICVGSFVAKKWKQCIKTCDLLKCIGGQCDQIQFRFYFKKKRKKVYFLGL